jgi:hypothetical protein
MEKFYDYNAPVAKIVKKAEIAQYSLKPYELKEFKEDKEKKGKKNG